MINFDNDNNLKLDLYIAKLIYEYGEHFKLYKNQIIKEFGADVYETIESAYTLIYPWTNEDLKFYYNLENLSNKKVLTIDGSGDHPIHLALAGARKIDAIDINPLSKYYSSLKIAIMETSSYDEFKASFIKLTENSEFILRKDFDLNKVKGYINTNQFFFWGVLLGSSLKNPYNLFYCDTMVSCYDVCEFFNEQMYYKAKEALLEAEITHYTMSITDPKITEKLDKYDSIFLSNVLEWETNDQKIYDVIGSLLNPGGTLYCYHMKDFIQKYNFKDLNFETSVITNKDIFPKRGITVYKKQ